MDAEKSYLRRGESTEVLALAADVTSDALELNNLDKRELGGIVIPAKLTDKP